MPQIIRRQVEAAPPDITITVLGRDRQLIADAVIEAIRSYEDAARRARFGTRQQGFADRLRVIFDQVVP